VATNTIEAGTGVCSAKCVGHDGHLTIMPPLSKAGDVVEFRGLKDDLMHLSPVSGDNPVHNRSL
jgi:hypothetical protein